MNSVSNTVTVRIPLVSPLPLYSPSCGQSCIWRLGDRLLGPLARALTRLRAWQGRWCASGPTPQEHTVLGPTARHAGEVVGEGRWGARGALQLTRIWCGEWVHVYTYWQTRRWAWPSRAPPQQVLLAEGENVSSDGAVQLLTHRGVPRNDHGGGRPRGSPVGTVWTDYLYCLSRIVLA